MLSQQNILGLLLAFSSPIQYASCKQGEHYNLEKQNNSIHSMSLNGDDWMAINGNKSIFIPATVPGSIYTDLLHAGVIGDPYYRFNDLTSRWISYDTWTYTKKFKVSRSILDRDVVQLVALGVDTVATVHINNYQVANTTNMFRRYVVNLKPFLQEGVNSIRFVFQSPVKYARQQSSRYPYTVPPECPPPAQQGECHGNFIRKEASSFSWDWGPAFPTVGIWKNLTLEAYDKVIIRDITVETHRQGPDDWLLIVNLFYDLSSSKVKVSVTLSLPELNVTQKDTITLNGGVAVLKMKLSKSVKVSPWWPAGHGDSKLYDLVLLSDTGNAHETKHMKVGFRDIELVQEAVPHSTGLSFYFKINGKPIFLKGSNWIPADAFQERISPEYIRQLLTSAKEANMNALRVWGGGVYESDTFYEIADELGIMIWQDMMFACAMFPSNTEFLENVKQEIIYQVRRLKSHPSIVIWSGNNENEGFLAPYQKLPGYKVYYQDYLKLYKDTIWAVVATEDRARPFVPSSPSDGTETIKEGWVAKNPQDNHYGDIHHYDYSSDSWNWRVFPIPRFASEYGLQSWCSAESLEKVSKPGDLVMNSQFVKHRQHHPDGNKQLLAEIGMHFKYPQSNNTTTPQGDFETFIYLSQINQAVGIKTETELYRRSQSSIVGGYGHTMGALFWQLNDIWQAPTWASLEYGGKWKMLHYFAKRFFAKEMLSPFLDGATVRVFLVNETIEQPFSEVTHLSPKLSKEGPIRITLYVTCYLWATMKPLKVWKISILVPSSVSGEIYSEKLATILSQSHCPSRQDCFLFFSLSPDGSNGPTNWLLLSNFTTVRGLQTPNFKVSDISKTGDQSFCFTLSTDRIAPFVWMEMTGIQGHFNDNGFIMVDSHIPVCFTSWETLAHVDIPKSLKVQSLPIPE